MLGFYDPNYTIADVTFLFSQHFDARLPAVEAAVRITSIYDAQVFTRRWVIRDKDRDLKTLLRKLERANSAALIDQAMADFKQALSVRDLLPSTTL
jgi:hypothetical protein